MFCQEKRHNGARRRPLARRQLRRLLHRPTLRFTMRDGRARILALGGALGLALCLAQTHAASAQNWAGNAEGSTTDGPTVDQYMKDGGPDLKFFAYGSLKIDGKTVNCGKRPT